MAADSSILDEVLKKYKALPAKEQAELRKIAEKDVENRLWVPTPGPQLDAFNSKADILLYGGAAGGAKTDLLLGLAFTAHKRSLILRREFTDLATITERAIKINRTRKGFNGSAPPKLKTADGRLIDFGACQRPGDETSYQGQDHDLICYDEVVHFLEDQVRFLFTWNRSTEPGQRCRVVMASNPPVGVQGDWIVKFFAPWLDPNNSNPAKDGELRWFVSDEDGHDLEVDGPEPFMISSKPVLPHSRTFIRSRLADNPFLNRDEKYAAKLDAMPEPYRSAFRDGNFMIAKVDEDFQVIPSDWVRAAQARWSPNAPAGVPMCALSVDVAQGGLDNTVLVARHDAWFGMPVSVPGARTPLGRDVAGLVVANRRDSAGVIIDMGGGYGGATFEWLTSNGFEEGVDLFAYKGATGSVARTVDGKLGFFNNRSATYWKFRELLDPSQLGGSPCALPPDPELVADLTAATFKVTARGIQVESKEDVVAKLRRSPDKGDATVNAWTAGPKVATHGQQWVEQGLGRRGGRTPKVHMGHPATRGR